MKKLLLIIIATVLSVSFFGCKKETSLVEEKSSDKQTRASGTYDHIIYNVKYKGFNGAYLGASSNSHLSEVKMIFSNTTADRWYMENRRGGYKKFWYQERFFWQDWHVLDANWSQEHACADQNCKYGYFAAALQKGDDRYHNQEWELIGTGDPASKNPRKPFRGVIVNRHSGRMLEARERNGFIQVMVGKIYKGSAEEKEFNETGCFCSTEENYLWDIYILPKTPSSPPR